MSRLERLVPELLDEQQRVLYERISGGPRSAGPQAFRLVGDDGALEGPFNAMLLCPAVGTALQALGAAVRYCTSLSDGAREMAILAVAAHEDSGFEWHAHEAVGRLAGLTGADLAAIRAGLAPTSANDVELIHPSGSTIGNGRTLTSVMGGQLGRKERSVDRVRTRVSAYRRVASDLRAQIRVEAFPPETAMPTEAEIARQYSVSRQTVRRAFLDLVAEGLVRRVPTPAPR